MNPKDPDSSTIESEDRKALSIFRLGRDEYFILASAVVGLAGMIAVCIFTPIRNFTVKPASSFLTKSESKAHAPEGLGKGLYYISDVRVALGGEEQFIDTDFDLEYDRSSLRTSHKKEIQSTDDEQRFFERFEARIRDSIINGFSGFSYTNKHGLSAVDRARDTLVEAANGALGQRTEIVTNVYFRRFVWFPPIGGPAEG